ncbi:Kdo hydroxylase family protein [bacterium]|nr:Kdo hydroxylase family protein [bacterium]
METQYALNPKLSNPFVMFDLTLKDLKSPDLSLRHSLQDEFEKGKILVIEGLRPENLDFFLDLPAARFNEWVPPVEDHEILAEPVNSSHAFWSFYPNQESILNFQQKLQAFQESWEPLQQNLFPNYQYQKRYWSWRMNAMDLGYLHLDVPPLYKEHQMRSFMNLSRRPRIIEVGPTLESLIAKFYRSANLTELVHLNATDYLQEIKVRLFKKLKFEDHYLPRHVLRLAPGAIWISHSSLITHGLIYGEKTVCLETRIPPQQIKNQDKTFHSIFERVKKNQIKDAEDFPLFLPDQTTGRAPEPLQEDESHATGPILD